MQESRTNVLTTLAGRSIPLPPAIRTDSARKAANDLRKHDMWLIEQARAEAISRDDEYSLAWISGMRPGKLSQADRDLANIYLFGEDGIICAAR